MAASVSPAVSLSIFHFFFFFPLFEANLNMLLCNFNTRNSKHNTITRIIIIIIIIFKTKCSPRSSTRHTYIYLYAYFILPFLLVSVAGRCFCLLFVSVIMCALLLYLPNGYVYLPSPVVCFSPPCVLLPFYDYYFYGAFALPKYTTPRCLRLLLLVFIFLSRLLFSKVSR